MEESHVKSQQQQNGAQKLRGLMLEALMLKKITEAAKYHLENVIAKQLEEIVKKKCMELILSSEFKKQMEDVVCNLLRVLTTRSLVDESSPPPPPPPPPLPPPPPPTLLLQFRSKEIPTLFADRKLGDQLESLEVTLVDASGKVVSEGPEASALLKLVILDADVGEREEAMTWEEFKKAELMPRNNKRPLLTGKLDVKLQKGEGRVDSSVCITDNSSWTRRKSFRLGLIPATSESQIVGVRTRPFTVKDHRSEGNKKCTIPKSSDNVWVLNGISKGGIYRSRLQKRGIHSVGDFIAYLELNQEELISLFKPQDFKIIAAHARMCETNREDASMHEKHRNEDTSYNGKDLITCFPNHYIDQKGNLLKVPDEAQPKFHGQDGASKSATSSHKSHQMTSFSPSKMPDSTVLAKDSLMVGNPQRNVCLESQNATISISHVTLETTECPFRSLGHWNESTLDPTTTNMAIEPNALNEFHDELDSLPCPAHSLSNLELHIDMDIDSNDLEYWDAFYPKKDGQ